MKCDFVTFDGIHFKCKYCGIELRFTEYQYSAPVYICNRAISPDTQGSFSGFIKKVQNFISATIQHIAAGSPMCNEETIKDRYDICQKCEHFRNNSCNLCGCPLKRHRTYISKLAWADQKCPINKW
jgi:hypothetical protein